MSVDSNNILTGGIATYTIKVNGSAIPDILSVYSVRVEKKVNRIPAARIVILDGDAATGKFDASSSSVFVPGNTITIEAGYDAKNSLIFQGIITAQSISIDPAMGSTLTVECRDEAVKLTVGRKCTTFSQQTDSEIISSIIGAAGLTAEVTATTTRWPQQVQHYATDWDFIMVRAEMNGMIVNVSNSKISVVKPDADTTSVLTVAYGDGLMEFSAAMNAINQLGSVTASAWDYKTQQISTGQAANDHAGPGNISSKKLSQVAAPGEYELQSSAPFEQADLTNWASAQMVKSEYSKIQGEAKFQGTGLVDPGKYITLQGIGDRFSGDHLISGVVHAISDGNWLTTTTIGLSPVWFSEEPNVMAPSASGVLPGARGLFNGTVKKTYEDPDSQFRILVDVPVFDTNGEGIWARLSNFYSTSGAGAFFLPEVGDEVVLGFLNEDPRYPVILGSMYSSAKLKPYPGLEPDYKNSMKAIVSKSGINIKFDDEKKVLTIETPARNSVIISDLDKKISIADEHKNSIIMSAEGIKIHSSTNITISADMKISLNDRSDVKSGGGD